MKIMTKCLICFLSLLVLIDLTGCQRRTPTSLVNQNFTGLSCEQKKTYLQAEIEKGRRCTTSSDCSATNQILSCNLTPCYGVPLNKNFNKVTLEAEIQQYETACTGPLACACPPSNKPPECQSGLCTFVF